jgi:hypothetical protein
MNPPLNAPTSGGGKHLNPDRDVAAPTAPTDAGWLRLSAALTAQLPPVAGRDEPSHSYRGLRRNPRHNLPES